MKLKEYKYKINGIKFTVGVGEVTDNHVHVEVNGTPYEVELDRPVARKASVVEKPKAAQAAPRTESGEKIISRPAAPATSGFTVTSPLPGTITTIKVREGDTVNAGDTVCLLEAMKMENDIHTTQGGVVKKIMVNSGDTLREGDPIMVIG